MAQLFLRLLLAGAAAAGGNCPSVLPVRLIAAFCYLETTTQQADNQTIDRQQTEAAKHVTKKDATKKNAKKRDATKKVHMKKMQ